MSKPPDEGPCEELGAACDGSTLRECRVIDQPPVETACALGCSADPTPHCARIVPSGGAVTPGHLDPDPGLGSTVLTGRVTLDSDDGSIDDGTTLLRPSGEGILAGIGYVKIGTVGVFRFDNLTIQGTLDLRGTRAVALVAIGDITVSNVIDARGDCMGRNGGPGGFDGGDDRRAGEGPGGGGSGSGSTDRYSGGAGGGYGALGGGGGSGSSTDGSMGGSAFGDAAITLLVGGAGGGGGGGDSGGGFLLGGIGGGGGRGGPGGGGGGAIQLVANGAIRITAGGVNAGGCGGERGQNDAGGGGGAGGTILVEAGTVELRGTSVLAVNGGGGGGGNGGENGGDGKLSSDAAPGGNGSGGDGGRGGNGASPGQLVGLAGGRGNKAGGGGGGAIGRIRIHTRSGAATIDAAVVVSPSLAGNPTTATQGKLRLQ